MSKLSVLKKIDYAGGILSVAGLTLLYVYDASRYTYLTNVDCDTDWLH